MTSTSLLSDPSFDVEKMFYYIDAHESEPTLIAVLLSNPSIMLSVAESSCFRVLERHASEIDQNVFKKCYEDLKLETWFRESKSKNQWWGIIIEDDLALYYRNVHRGEIETFRGPGAAKMARVRWEQLNMYRLGTENKKVLGNRNIDLIRKATWEAIRKYGYKDNHRKNDPTNVGACFKRNPTYKNAWKHDYLDISISAASPYIIKVNYKEGTKFVKTQFQRDIDRKKGIFKAPDVISSEILNWLATVCNHFKKVYNAHI